MQINKYDNTTLIEWGSKSKQSLDRIHHPLIRTLNKLGIEKTYFQTINAIYG